MKYELIDLVNKGSHSRKVLDPSLIVKDGDNLKYLPGNILDANTVDGMVSKVASDLSEVESDLNAYEEKIGTNMDQTHTLVERVGAIEDLIDSDSDDVIDKFNEIVDFLNGLDPDDPLIDIINSHITSEDVKNVVVLTQDQYDAIAVKDVDTEYNIIEEV